MPLCLVQAERNQLIKEVSESYSCGLPFSDPLRASSRSHVIGFHGAFYDAPSRRLGIVMDYVNGGNLEEVYKASAIKGGKGGLTDGCFASIMFQAVTALNFMHSHHLIHRDFKPSSLLIDVNGQVKLTNLGNLRKLAKTAAEAASVVGTTCYFAPERIIGVSFTNSADIWHSSTTTLSCWSTSYRVRAPSTPSRNRSLQSWRRSSAGASKSKPRTGPPHRTYSRLNLCSRAGTRRAGLSWVGLSGGYWEAREGPTRGAHVVSLHRFFFHPPPCPGARGNEILERVAIFSTASALRGANSAQLFAPRARFTAPFAMIQIRRKRTP